MSTYIRVTLIAVILSAFWTIFAFAAPPMKVVYGFDREYPPFSFEEAKGKPVGFDVDIISAIFREEHVDLIFRPLTWDQVLVELSSGSVHLSSGMVKTEQRKLLYSFSDEPTLPTKIKLFTKPANRVGNITLLRGKRVAVKKGTYQQRELERFGGLNIKPYRSQVDALRALHRDEVEAYGGPVQSAYYYINRFKFGSIAAVGTPLAVEDAYIVANMNKPEVLEMVNRGMQRILANGEYDRIYRKWFVPELVKEEQEQLFSAAKNAAINAYAPYTKNPVGAAVLTRSGRIFTGCNVENAQLSESETAIRTAVLKAVSEGEYEFRAVAAVGPNGRIIAPSAADRQFLFEFGRGILAAVEPEKGRVEMHMMSQLLPAPFAKRPDSYHY